MSFMHSYKALEKLCNEIYGTSRGVSAYIEDMENNIDGIRPVKGWSEDLKMLKHCRRLRNQIVHDPEWSEDECDAVDKRWVDEFHSRIMNRQDPLAELHRVSSGGRMEKTRKKEDYTTYTVPHSSKKPGCITYILGVLVIVTVVIVCVCGG